MLGGGSGCRNINLALSRGPSRLTRIVPAWDSGGSSRAIREALGILAVGDIRQALMTMAHGEKCAGNVIRMCNSRLSEAVGQRQLRMEFEFFADCRHPFLKTQAPSLRNAITRYLDLFSSRLPEDFDLGNGSVGNFILAGAYLAHDNDVNAAMSRFKDLCGIEGNVWPSSVVNDVHLSAQLSDGRVITRQDRITSMPPSEPPTLIDEIWLTRGSDRAASVEANGPAIGAILEADVILYGPGSLFSSVLPHLMVEGILDAIRSNARAVKIFVGNITDCAETRGLTLASQLSALLRVAQSRSKDDLLTHILANRNVFPFTKRVGKFSYLQVGSLLELCSAQGISVVSGDFEDLWQRGTRDGDAVALEILKLAEPMC
ncbi:YvcK family protein [Mesorhizobium loti]|nr:YvcK family protein [Mesorhizobium loti]QIA25842.1 YvcK family protein [Mesorhizobium sp. AA22]